LILTSTRHQRRTDFGAHRRLTCLLSNFLTSDYRPENQFRNTADSLAEESCNNLKVSTITEIQEAIDKLPAKERTADFWHSARMEPNLWPALHHTVACWLAIVARRWKPQRMERLGWATYTVTPRG